MRGVERTRVDMCDFKLQVGKEGCKKGVCTLHVNNEDMTVEFQHLGIQCVRKKDIEESLKQRSDIRVDPFKQGFKHVENPSSIDLNAVKLCFQVNNAGISCHSPFCISQLLWVRCFNRNTSFSSRIGGGSGLNSEFHGKIC